MTAGPQPRQPLWRVFPWNPEAEEGERHSPGYVPPIQGQGRFDLPDSPGGTLYLAETPEHAVAEMIQHFRGSVLEDSDLRVAGHRMALVAVTVPEDLLARVADLCDPRVLVQLAVRPDLTASRDRRITQRIAQQVYAAGHPGLRWWSALFGEWHTVVLFVQRARGVEYGEPEPVDLAHPVLQGAAAALGIAVKKRRR